MDPIKEARKAEKRAAAQLKEEVYRGKILALAEEGVEFMPFPKIPRLNRDITITEKIDGTNGAIGIVGDPFRGYTVYAQSRGRIITPENDNAGFAAWVEQNKALLAPVLGAGLHFGEWWGKGIQRGYGQIGLLHPDGFYWVYIKESDLLHAAARAQALADVLNKHKVVLEAPRAFLR